MGKNGPENQEGGRAVEVPTSFAALEAIKEQLSEDPDGYLRKILGQNVALTPDHYLALLQATDVISHGGQIDYFTSAMGPMALEKHIGRVIQLIGLDCVFGSIDPIDEKYSYLQIQLVDHALHTLEVHRLFVAVFYLHLYQYELDLPRHVARAVNVHNTTAKRTLRTEKTEAETAAERQNERLYARLELLAEFLEWYDTTYPSELSNGKTAGGLMFKLITSKLMSDREVERLRDIIINGSMQWDLTRPVVGGQHRQFDRTQFQLFINNLVRFPFLEDIIKQLEADDDSANGDRAWHQ